MLYSAPGAVGRVGEGGGTRASLRHARPCSADALRAALGYAAGPARRHRPPGFDMRCVTRDSVYRWASIVSTLVEFKFTCTCAHTTRDRMAHH